MLNDNLFVNLKKCEFIHFGASAGPLRVESCNFIMGNQLIKLILCFKYLSEVLDEALSRTIFFRKPFREFEFFVEYCMKSFSMLQIFIDHLFPFLTAVSLSGFAVIELMLTGWNGYRAARLEFFLGQRLVLLPC